MTHAECLAEFVVRSSYEDLSDAAARELKIRVLDSLGCAMGALEGEPVRMVREQISDYAQEDIRRLVSAVPQRTHVFNDTLRNNLLLADPEADDEALELALELAWISGFVERLPEGLDTHVGE